MKTILHITSIFFISLFLYACSGTREHMSLHAALDNNDLTTFKSEIVTLQESPNYTQETKAELLYNALTLSVSKNSEAARFLIEQGVPVNYPENQPDSFVRGKALTNAVIKNDKDMVTFLLAHGADANIVIEPVEPEENNILLLSLDHDDLVISNLLLESGANPNQWHSLFISSLLSLYDDNPKVSDLLVKYGAVTKPSQAQRFGYTLTKTTVPATKATTAAPEKIQSDSLLPKENNAAATNVIKSKQVNPATSLPNIEDTKMNNTTNSIKERLTNIEILKSQGVITEIEYSQARQKILSEL